MIAEAVTITPALPIKPAPIVVTPPQPPAPEVTVEQYLEMERKSETRHEYVDGKVVAMAGESLARNRIARNIVVKLQINFADTDCEAFFENIRARVTPTRYRYPDVMALCGTPQTDGTNPPALLNPAVIFEVLSPSTEHEDREDKWLEYQRLASVTDYIMVAQDMVEVAHFVRASDAQWTVTIHNGLQNILTLASLNTTLPLADIYRKIVFPTVESPAVATE